MQELLTDEQMEKLKQIGLSEQESENQIPIVRLHIPGKEAYWLFSCIISDTEQMAYGIFEIGLGNPELGYFDLNEIAELKFKGGLELENDLQFKGERSLMKYAEIAQVKAFQELSSQISQPQNEVNPSSPNTPQP